MRKKSILWWQMVIWLWIKVTNIHSEKYCVSEFCATSIETLTKTCKESQLIDCILNSGHLMPWLSSVKWGQIIKDTPIIPKFSLYLLKLGPNTKSRSLNTILAVSGSHDVIVTYYENYVNSQFMLIPAWNFAQILNRGHWTRFWRFFVVRFFDD